MSAAAAGRTPSDTVRLDEAAARLGIGRSLAFELVRRGEFPVPAIRLGTVTVVPLAHLERLLGLREEGAAPAAPSGPNRALRAEEV